MTDTSKQWIKDAARELLGEIGPDRLVPESYKQIWLDKVESVIAKHAPKEEVDTSKERAAFEKWADSKSYLLGRRNDAYISISTDYLWRGWMARAEQSTETSPTEPRAMTISEIPDELKRTIIQQTARECAVIAAEADTNWNAEHEIYTRFDIETSAEAPRPVEPGTK